MKEHLLEKVHSIIFKLYYIYYNLRPECLYLSAISAGICEMNVALQHLAKSVCSFHEALVAQVVEDLTGPFPSEGVSEREDLTAYVKLFE